MLKSCQFYQCAGVNSVNGDDHFLSERANLEPCRIEIPWQINKKILQHLLRHRYLYLCQTW